MNINIFLYSQEVSETIFLIPYVLSAFGLWVLFIGFRFYEVWYSNRTDKVLYRDLLVFRTLSRKQKKILSTFHFYTLVSPKEQRRFEHRVKVFISETNFIGREQLVITEEIEILVAATAIMLTFGRKNYAYNYVDTVLIYPKAFYSLANEAYHKGEFNPMQKTIVFSWEDFREGYRITDDNLNVGIHEFVHALQIGAKKEVNVDSLRFERVYQRILRLLMSPEIKAKIAKDAYFRSYAFTNEFEFMAVIIEHFFESPEIFKAAFPEMYAHTKTLLNFNFAHY